MTAFGHVEKFINSFVENPEDEILNSLMGKLVNVKDIRNALESKIEFKQMVQEARDVEQIKRILVIAKLTIVQEIGYINSQVRL